MLSEAELEKQKLPIDKRYPLKRFEVISRGKNFSKVLCRDMEGHVCKVSRKAQVFKAGDLSRAPDGESESKVSFATFPVAHFVNKKALKIRDYDNGTIYSALGDEQSTPHFMRYSGLTGAAIGAMVLNNYIRGSGEGQSVSERLNKYISDVNWSNSEVVIRGVGSGFGVDGFLRPGFEFSEFVQYILSKIDEQSHEGKRQEWNPHTVLSDDWKQKFACGLVPRGLEEDRDFIRDLRVNLLNNLDEALQENIGKVINELFHEPSTAESIRNEIVGHFNLIVDALNKEKSTSFKLRQFAIWDGYSKASRASLLNSKKDFVKKKHLNDQLEKIVEKSKMAFEVVELIILFAQEQARELNRESGQVENQSNPVDSLIQENGFEIQGFVNGFNNSAAFSAVGSAGVSSSGLGLPGSEVLTALSPILAFSSVANAARYKRRNEEAQTVFFQEQLPLLKQQVFALIDQEEKVFFSDNPFVAAAKKRFWQFLKEAEYYELELPVAFKEKFHEAINYGDATVLDYLIHDIKVELLNEDYQSKSYVKDVLVDLIYDLKNLHGSFSQNDEMDPQSKGIPKISEAAKDLYERIVTWEPTLSESLETRPVHLGLFKKRKFSNSHVSSLVKYVVKGLKGNKYDRLNTETQGILDDLINLEHLMAKEDQEFRDVFSRNIHDLRVLLHATLESHKASLILLSGTIAGSAGLAATANNILNALDSAVVFSDAVSFALATVTPIPALLTVPIQIKQIVYMRQLQKELTQRLENRSDSAEVKKAIIGAQKVITANKLIAGTRISASMMASAAIFGSMTAAPLSVGLGAAALGQTGIALAGKMLVDYRLVYRMDERAPQLLCEAFRPEILELYEKYSRSSSTQSTLVNSKIAWEYTGYEFLRKYRFDILFDEEQLTSLLQHIQGGMQKMGYSI